MKRATMVLAVLALVWGGVGQTKASVLTFDDIPGIQVPVPNGYGGLHWNNLSINNGDTFGVGYGAGTVSHPKVIFNGFGNPADVTSATPFTFVGAYLTGAWRDGLSIEVVGSRGGTTLYDQTVVVDAIAPTFFDFRVPSALSATVVCCCTTPYFCLSASELS